LAPGISISPSPSKSAPPAGVRLNEFKLILLVNENPPLLIKVTSPVFVLLK